VSTFCLVESIKKRGLLFLSLLAGLGDLLLSPHIATQRTVGYSKKKNLLTSLVFLCFHRRPPLLLLRPRHRYVFFFDFFRPCPCVVMSGSF
jgi:hypothetical protein